MKRLATLIMLLTALAACEPPTGYPEGSRTERTEKGYNLKVIDECEYIEVDNGIGSGRVYSLTHKGDCKNLIHSCGR